MPRADHEAVQFLAEARAGSTHALGQMLDACRNYLLLVAERELNPELRVKGGASDLVQETLLDAVHAFPSFEGDSEAALLAWLRRLLLNNVISFARRFRMAGKRAMEREISLGGEFLSSHNPRQQLAADVLSPSKEAIRKEETESIQLALEHLPEDYRRIIHLRYEEDRSFEEIGRLLELTPNAARKLWVRAIKRLQLETDPSS